MVSVADRDASVVFAATVTKIVASPVPDVGAMPAHGCALDAVHEQVGAFVVMAIEPDPPGWPNGLPRPEVSTVTLHARPACETWSVSPPIVSVPLRAVVVEFGSTE